MLLVLAQRHPDWLTAAQLGTLAGVPRTKSTFRNYRAHLRGLGLLEQDGADRLRLTAAGLAAAGPLPPRPQSTHELVDMWKAKLAGGERRMLDELVTVFPNELDPHELGRRAAVEVDKSTFRNYRARLRAMGLIQERGGRLRASPTLFPDAAVAPVPAQRPEHDRARPVPPQAMRKGSPIVCCRQPA
jgi:hypothetical protein